MSYLLLREFLKELNELQEDKQFDVKVLEVGDGLAIAKKITVKSTGISNNKSPFPIQ